MAFTLTQTDTVAADGVLQACSAFATVATADANKCTLDGTSLGSGGQTFTLAAGEKKSVIMFESDPIGDGSFLSGDYTVRVRISVGLATTLIKNVYVCVVDSSGTNLGTAASASVSVACTAGVKTITVTAASIFPTTSTDRVYIVIVCENTHGVQQNTSWVADQVIDTPIESMPMPMGCWNAVSHTRYDTSTKVGVIAECVNDGNVLANGMNGGKAIFTITPDSGTYDGDAANITAAQKSAAGEMLQTPITIMNCPTRRSSVLFRQWLTWGPYDANQPSEVARSDYAGSAGSVHNEAQGPSSYSAGDAHDWGQYSNSTGIVFQGSEIKLAHIRDGASNTYLVGEKNVTREHYTDGVDGGDNHSMYQGMDRDTVRWTVESDAYFPLGDHPGYEQPLRFGSAHASGWQAVLCDGSVRPFPFELNRTIHRQLGNRKDGEVIDSASL